MGRNWKNPCAKRNSQMQNYELIYTQVLSDFHSPRTNFGKKVYILALCVYINPKMSSKNRPLQLSSTIGHIRVCHILITLMKSYYRAV